jgi:hypothetical protein
MQRLVDFLSAAWEEGLIQRAACWVAGILAVVYLVSCVGAFVTGAAKVVAL